MEKKKKKPSKQAKAKAQKRNRAANVWPAPDLNLVDRT